jgi:predicted permease
MHWWQIRKRNADLERELASDLALEEEEQRDNGLSSEQARTAARRALGNSALIREHTHEAWGIAAFERLAQDVRYAIRQLSRARGFTLVAVITLALGIGANTAIFTLVQTILLRSLPVANPSQLVRIGDRIHCCYFSSFESDDGDFDLISYDLFRHFQQAAPQFEQLSAVEAGGASFSVRWASAPARELRAEYVSGNYFSMLGVNALAGRTLSQQDDRIGAPPVIVLSYPAWQREFGGDASITGSTVYIQQRAFTVAGVAPSGFFGDRISPFPPDFWLPLSTEPLIEGKDSALLEPSTAWLYAIGRLRPGADTTSLQARLSAELQSWMKTRPSFSEHGGAAEIAKQHVVLSSAGGGIQKLQEQTGTGLRMLMFLSCVVLLMACANIANLLLARSVARRTEIAVRIGLGASRGRIINQILTESLLLSTLGGIAGLAVAFFGSRAILALAFPRSTNLPVEAGPSWTVLAFALAISILTGLLFAGAPAWLSSGTQPAEASRGHNPASRDRASIPQRMLLVLQLALSIVLLATAFLATRSFYNLEHQQIGIETINRYSIALDLEGSGVGPERLNAIYRSIGDRLSALPGARTVSFARYLPLEGNQWGACVFVQGRAVPGPKDQCFSDWSRVSSAFLDSVGVPVLRGRGFAPEDSSSPAQVAIVNQAFVRRFFPNQNPIGQRFGADRPEYASAFQIVGVFADFKLSNPRTQPQPLFLRPLGQIYHGYKTDNEQAGETHSLYLDRIVLQFDRPQLDAERLVRAAISQVDSSIPVVRVIPYPQVVAGNFNQDRLLARLTEAFAIVALILASVGLYGVMSYLTARRTSEIGIRMALGASRATILSLILRSAVLQVLAGLLIGIPAAVYAARMMQRLLYDVTSNDPFAFIGAAAILALCVAVAAIVPAARAASVDPMQALRTE